VRLANVAIVRWPLFNAWCTAHGVAPFGGTLMTAVSASYAWMRDGLYGEELAKFEQALWETPIRSAAAAAEELPEHLRQAEASAFLAALGESLPGEQMTAGIF
jgi:hypothetical protein